MRMAIQKMFIMSFTQMIHIEVLDKTNNNQLSLNKFKKDIKEKNKPTF